MRREDVIRNIMETYQKYGISRKQVEEAVRSGEANGFSYQTIYTGLRMALGSVTGNEEHFTVSEMAEALGEPEEEIMQKIEELREEAEAAGCDPDSIATVVQPDQVQRFIIPSGGLRS